MPRNGSDPGRLSRHVERASANVRQRPAYKGNDNPIVLDGDPLHDAAIGLDSGHWFCPECGAFDGPITLDRCDVCVNDRDDLVTVQRLVAVDALTNEQIIRAVLGAVVVRETDRLASIYVAVDAVEQALATILADYAITTRTAQPRRVLPGEVISRLRMETPALPGTEAST